MKEEAPKKNMAQSTQPSVAPSASVNPGWRRFIRKSTTPSYESLTERLLEGDRVALAQAITLVESTLPKHIEQAHYLVEHCLPQSGQSTRIGITGAPGAGKSTFIDAFGKTLIESGRQVAVLAIDPSSQLSKGSILGDKTRMPTLANAPQAFIRPSPSGSSLGGVARKTRETILLCEAAGFDTIIVETVGVGQSETAVHSMVDFFILLLIPGAGDELQGIKRGIVEMADLILVNKADGEQLTQAKLAQAAYLNALHLYPARENGWIPPVRLCSALCGEGIAETGDLIRKYTAQMQSKGLFQHKRQGQAHYWMREAIAEQLHQLFYGHPDVQHVLPLLEAEVAAGKKSPFYAAEELLRIFIHSGPSL
jgi:LAO/AO transport system kinase